VVSVTPGESVTAPDVAVIGNVNVDLIVRDVTDLPPPGTERTVDAVQIRLGGAAATMAVTLADLGVGSELVGSVGGDVFGSYLLEQLAAAGVNTSNVRTVPNSPTGVSIAFEGPERERSFLTHLGSLDRFDASMVPPEVLSARFVVFTGYFLLPALASGLPALMTHVRDAGGTVLFDAGWDPSGWTPPTMAAIAELLPSVDVLLPNAIEACAMTGENDPLPAARALQGATGGWVVVKLGGQGCLAVGPDGTEATCPALPVDVVDTVGAGDAFDAGIVAALRAGRPVPQALEFATRVASRRVGGRSTVALEGWERG
jgi:sugar/nucleoside kinase (ribokinase family)